MKEGDAGFKQRKKKKAKRSTRKADADEDGEGMNVDAAPTFTRRVVDDGPQNLVDDDDLQAALARSRRTNAKSKPKMRSEDLAAQSKLCVRA
jgi:U4/U6.U5 tri-snRNP-associated protein 1